jgi:hypothetical protein
MKTQKKREKLYTQKQELVAEKQCCKTRANVYYNTVLKTNFEILKNFDLKTFDGTVLFEQTSFKYH